MSHFDAYQKEIVLREAPRWAWDVIDETLAMDAISSSFSKELREVIDSALQAMINACEHPED